MWTPVIDKMKDQSILDRLTTLEKKLNKYLLLGDVAELEKRVEKLEKKLLLDHIELLEERVKELEKKNDK